MDFFTEDSPVRHTRGIKAQKRRLIEQPCKDMGSITEPKAQTLFETSAEVVPGLVKAFTDDEKKCEDAWKDKPPTSLPKKAPSIPQGERSS